MDKEKFVCLSCNQLVELDKHGFCEKCGANSLIPAIVLQELAKHLETPSGTINKVDVPSVRSKTAKTAKQLRWWHFVAGPFETFISNYRCKDIEEATRHVTTSSRYEWSLRSKESIPDLHSEELDNEEFQKRYLW